MTILPEVFAIHQGAVERQWNFEWAVEGLARRGICSLIMHRSDIGEYGVDRSANLISDAGLQVLDVSRCASLTESDPGCVAANHDENRTITKISF